MHDANTKSLVYGFSEILIFEYFEYLTVAIEVFFTDSKLPHKGQKCNSEELEAKLPFRWSRDQCSAKRERRLHFLVGIGFEIKLG